MQGSAAEALGELGDALAVEPLTAALKDSDGGVRKAATDALEALGWMQGKDEGDTA